MKYFSKSALYYLIAPLISLMLLVFYFRFDAYEISEKSADYFGTIFSIKTIAKEGWNYCNSRVGYPVIDTNCFNDYTTDHSSFVTLMFRLIGFFLTDPFQIYSTYFVLSVGMIAVATNFVFRQFGISKFNSAVFAVLFSLARARVETFGWWTVGNYFTIPFIFLLCYKIIENELSILSYENQKISLNQKAIKKNFLTIFFACLSLLVSAYYGYALIILLALTTFIHLLKWNKFDINFFSNVLLIIILIILAIAISIPTLIFWMKNGQNDIISRNPIESIFHGLSFSSMVIPVSNHYFESFRDFHKGFTDIYKIIAEKKSSQIGLFASIGFCFLLMHVVAVATKSGDNEHKNSFLGVVFPKNKYSVLAFASSLNFLAIIFFFSEGIHAFLNYFFTNIRALARLNIIFVFLSYLFFGIYFDEIIRQKKITKNVVIVKIFIVFLAVLAFFDLSGSRTRGEGESSRAFFHKIDSPHVKYDIYKNFVQKIEKSIPAQSMIFVTPVKGFPESYDDNYLSIIGYLFSENLKFSYPVIKNRKSYLWQKEVMNLSFENFIDEVRKEGFSGVWVQRDIYDKISARQLSGGSNSKLLEFEKNLDKICKNKIESEDKNIVFYQID